MAQSDLETTTRSGVFARAAPALTLVVLAPLIAEVLPGATRMSAIFVFPIEMAVWGIGALLIRAVVRNYRLGWRNMLLLAIALAIAEECLIQQTSLAPLVISLSKAGPYARAFGVNWIYLLWALVYESVLVVMVPVALTELIFRSRRQETWVSRAGLAAALPLFAVGCFFAWFSWTQIARTKVFHLPAFTPPPEAVAIAAGAILLLFLLALGPLRRALAKPSSQLGTPPPWLLGAAAFVPSVLWYGLILLAFNIRPDFPPLVAAAAGIAVVAALLATFPRWAADPRFGDGHAYAIVFAILLGTMGVGQIGFIGATPLDLYGKLVLDGLAVLLMLRLGFALRARTKQTS